MDRTWNAASSLFLPMLSIVFLLLAHQGTCQNILKQSLDGSDWSSYDDYKQYIFPATVPGSIYSDLKTAGKIGDIYFDVNDVNYRWVSERNWTFEKHFNVDPSLSSKSQIYLTAHGLDTVGDVYLNNFHLGSVNNQFVRYRWPVKSYLLFGSLNSIVIKFRSAQNYALEKYLEYPYIVPPSSQPPEQNGEPHANFIRKMQSSFSWDWGPAFPTQGIWKSIELEAYNDYLLRDISVDTIAPTPSSGNRWQLGFVVNFECQASLPVQGVMNFQLGATSFPPSNFYQTCSSDGEASIKGILMMNPDIEAWYPNGVGAQNLYKFVISVASLAGERQNKTIRVGFRTVEIIQQRLSSATESYSFVFHVNGKPIYAKGSNWIPAHVLQESISEAYLQDLLISAKLANMNMLRVWGGGVYESERFYELADELGILLWHDLMFACALYPVDKPFLDTVSVEVKQQIRRIQHHPSIALWAGNNENEVALATIWWPQILHRRAQFQDEYRQLYIDTIEPIVLAEDPKRSYLSSSPSNGIVDARENYTAQNPSDECFGDVHHYVVTGNVWDWKIHPSAKFVSEYGFQSWSSLETLSKSVSAKYLKYPLPQQLEHREHQAHGTQYLTEMINKNFVLPNETTPNAFRMFVFLSQVHQAMAIKLQTEFYRRNREVTSLGTGNTMGALYWQLNDIWPTVSWSSVEFGGKWKMLHYYAQKMFDNVLVDAYLDADTLKVALTRDEHDSGMQMDVTISVYQWAKNYPTWQTKTSTFSQPFSSQVIYQNSLSNILSGGLCASPSDCIIRVEASNTNSSIERDNFLLLAPPNNSSIPLSVTIVRNVSPPVYNNGLAKFTIDFQAYNGIAPFVWLEMSPESKIHGLFSENGFILFDKRSITFQTLASNITSSVISQALRMVTLSDFYK